MYDLKTFHGEFFIYIYLIFISEAIIFSGNIFIGISAGAEQIAMFQPLECITFRTSFKLVSLILSVSFTSKLQLVACW